MIKRIATPGTPLPRLSLNVGAGLDLPTGYFIKGKYGEDILIGGMSNLQGEMGDPNTDKSTIALYMLLSGLNTVAAVVLFQNIPNRKIANTPEEKKPAYSCINW